MACILIKTFSLFALRGSCRSNCLAVSFLRCIVRSHCLVVHLSCFSFVSMSPINQQVHRFHSTSDAIRDQCPSKLTSISDCLPAIWFLSSFSLNSRGLERGTAFESFLLTFFVDRIGILSAPFSRRRVWTCGPDSQVVLGQLTFWKGNGGLPGKSLQATP